MKWAGKWYSVKQFYNIIPLIGKLLPIIVEGDNKNK